MHGHSSTVPSRCLAQPRDTDACGRTASTRERRDSEASRRAVTDAGNEGVGGACSCAVDRCAGSTARGEGHVGLRLKQCSHNRSRTRSLGSTLEADLFQEQTWNKTRPRLSMNFFSGVGVQEKNARLLPKPPPKTWNMEQSTVPGTDLEQNSTETFDEFFFGGWAPGKNCPTFA